MTKVTFKPGPLHARCTIVPSNSSQNRRAPISRRERRPQTLGSRRLGVSDLEQKNEAACLRVGVTRSRAHRAANGATARHGAAHDARAAGFSSLS